MAKRERDRSTGATTGGKPSLASAACEIRVLVVDDHPFMRDGLVAVINRQSDMTVVASAGDGEEAVRQFVAHRPTITLMDLRLPGMTGSEAIAAIRKHDRQARIVVLTTYGDVEEVYRAFRAGASSFLLKEMKGEQVLETLRAVHRGQACIPPEIAAKVTSRLPQADLSPHEERILEFMARGLNNREVADALRISDNTVKYHMKSILGKLAARDRTQAILSALRRGIIQITGDH